jgi:ribosomal protein S8
MTKVFILGDLVSRINVALNKRLTHVSVRRTVFSISILKLFQENGLIYNFVVKDDSIVIGLKYHKNRRVPRELYIVSRPGLRIYPTTGNLRQKFFAGRPHGFYILSSSKGLFTSNDALLYSPNMGEILF